MKETTKKILAMPRTMTVSEVAKELGVSYHSVFMADKKYGAGFARKQQGKCTDYKLMHEMIESGTPYPQISKLFNMHPHSVRYHAEKIGHSRRGSWDEELIISLYKKKKPIKVIEGLIGCSSQVIYRIIKKHGIELNRK